MAAKQVDLSSGVPLNTVFEELAKWEKLNLYGNLRIEFRNGKVMRILAEELTLFHRYDTFDIKDLKTNAK